MNKVFGVSVLVVGAFLVGCSGGDDARNDSVAATCPAPAASSGAPASPAESVGAVAADAKPLDIVQRCEATLVCTDEGMQRVVTMRKGTDGCYLGNYRPLGAITLGWDGHVASDPVPAHAVWTASGTDLTVCDSNDDCVPCVESDAATPTNNRPGSCSGAAQACAAFDPTSCQDEIGCYYSSWYVDHPNAPTEYHHECVGTPIACEQFATTSACEAQKGCAWN